MKRAFDILFVLILFGSGTALAQVKHVPVEVQKQIIAFDEQRSNAIVSKNFEALDKIYSENFFGISGRGGNVTRTDLYEIFKLDDSKTIFSKSDWEFRYVKNAVLGIGKLTATSKDGKVLFASRFMHIYEPVGDSWVITYGQSTPIPLQ